MKWLCKLAPMVLRCAALAALAASPARAAGPLSDIRIWGGPNNKLALGCLTCDESLPDSVFNKDSPLKQCDTSVGTPVSSIFCRRWATAKTDPCAVDGKSPPVLLDDEGNYYGVLSLGGRDGHPDSVCSSEGSYQSVEACQLLRALCTRGPPPKDLSRRGAARLLARLGPCGEGVTLARIDDQGRFVTLGDGSRWQVTAAHSDAVIRTWFVGDKVQVCPGERLANPTRHQLIDAAPSGQ
jgi:hypothetical protein